MFSASETLVKLKEFVTNNTITQNKYVRYATCVFSSAMMLTAFQQIYMKIYRKRNRLPNGPIGYPFIGCLPQFVFHLKEFLLGSSKHGPLTHFQFLGSNMVIINDYKLARLLLTDERLLTRMNVHEVYPGMLPLTGATNGKEWVAGRKLLFFKFGKLD